MSASWLSGSAVSCTSSACREQLSDPRLRVEVPRRAEVPRRDGLLFSGIVPSDFLEPLPDELLPFAGKLRRVAEPPWDEPLPADAPPRYDEPPPAGCAGRL